MKGRLDFRRRRLETQEEKTPGSVGGICSSSSRGSSNNSSPDSQSPSPPTTSTNGGSDTTNNSNGECCDPPENATKKYTEPSSMRRPWKKRYHEMSNLPDHDDDLEAEREQKRPRNCGLSKAEKRSSGGALLINEEVGKEDLDSESSNSPTNCDKRSSKN